MPMKEHLPLRVRRQTEMARSQNLILHDRDRWSFKDSPLEGNYNYAYDDTFSFLLPEGHVTLRNYIESVLANQKGKAVALELGGLGSSLFVGFTSDFFVKTAAITLHDSRKRSQRKDDAIRRHTVIQGDMLRDTTKEQVQGWLGKEKVDLIIERMIGGHDLLPEEPFFLSKQADYWYQQLSEGGLFFAELPSAFYPYAAEWKRMIDERYKDTLDVDLVSSEILRLHKLPGAPEALPLLSARDVIRKQRKFHSL